MQLNISNLCNSNISTYATPIFLTSYLSILLPNITRVLPRYYKTVWKVRTIPCLTLILLLDTQHGRTITSISLILPVSLCVYLSTCLKCLFTSWYGSNSYEYILFVGHVDFTIEVERALRVLDAAILVLCRYFCECLLSIFYRGK